MPESTKTTARRKHVTTACLSCRESKVKCDGATPSCSNCINKSKDCRYPVGDNRRKLSLRLAIELLSQRVDQLTQVIIENGLPVPAPPDHDEATLDKVLSAIGFPFEKSVGRPTHSEIDGEYHTDHNANEHHATEHDADGGPSMLNPPESDKDRQYNKRACVSDRGLTSAPAHSNHSMLQTSNSTGVDETRTSSTHWSNNHADGLGSAENSNDPFQLSSAGMDNASAITSVRHELYNDQVVDTSPSSMNDPAESDSIEELVNQLSDRMGTLHVASDGQIRFYGPTSNFMLVDMPSADPEHVHRTIRNDGQEYLDRLGVGAEVPPALEEHLVNLYFTWQDPAFHIVDRDMYEEGKRIWYEQMLDTPYYSEALRNAICSLGAAFETHHHPDFVTFPKSLADFFADRAKALLEIELDAPCVATIQAIVVTSCHDMGCTRDARGWLFSGMAIRLAFDLALHKDMSIYVAKGVISKAEAEVRRTIFWGAYLVDQVWSFHLGRQFRINMDDVTCGKPGGDLMSTAQRTWTPYVNQSSLTPLLPLPDHLEEVCRQRVLLCEIMSPLGQHLYGSMSVHPQLLQELHTATVAQLLEWKDKLPAPLQISLDHSTTPYLPHVLIMHTHYYQNIISAHRPWMARTNSQLPDGLCHTQARDICVDAAISIAQILQLYEQRYTLRRINIQGPAIACSAALLLIFAEISHSGRTSGSDIAQHLSVCFRALDEFGHSWESARRARTFLTRVQRRWKLQARQKSNSRLFINDNSSISRKRPMTASDLNSYENEQHWTWQTHSRPSIASARPLQSSGRARSSDIDVDMNFDWMLGANAQTVSGSWISDPYSTSGPSDLMNFMGDA